MSADPSTLFEPLMIRSHTENEPAAQLSKAEDAVSLLADLATAGQVVIEADFDLDADLRFADRQAVLLDTKDGSRLVYTTPGNGESTVENLPLSEIESAELEEDVGLDRINLKLKDGRRIELPFSRRRRLSMSRLHHKIQKRLDDDAGPDLSIPPDRDEHREETFDARRTAVLWRLLEVARPLRWHIIGALVLTIVGTAFMVLPAFLTRYLIDGAVNPSTTTGMTTSERGWELLYWVGLYAGTIVGMLLCIWGRLQLLSYVGSQISGMLRHRVYEHIHTMSMRFFGKHRTGSLITRVTSDTDRLWDFIVFGSVDFIKNILLMIFAATVMFYSNWKLALVALIPVPLVVLMVWWKTKVMVRKFSRLWTYWSRLTAIVGDTLPGAKVVKAFAGERREVQKFDKRSDDFTNDEYATVSVWVNMQPMVEGTMFLSRVMILLAGGWFVIQASSAGEMDGANTLGVLFMFLMIIGFFHMAINDLAMKQRQVTRAATSAQRVFEILDTPVEIKSKPNALAPDEIIGKVEFRDVSFSYDGTKPVLRHVSLTAEPGEMIGLCGHSGAGKSTFVNLVSRFYDVSDGAILLDGHDVRDYDVEWLRGHVGVVLQDPYLFYGTIADNIRYGRPEASLGDVITAARAANAHDFITKQPGGYDTMVGERGQSLSGGERQRVSIARAILHNPKVLILDEATSSVDTETEREIQQALDRLMTGRTTFAIAHRLSTLRDSDKIVVLDDGRIAEIGTHEQLVDRDGGAYQKLYQAQADMAADTLEATHD